MAVLIILGYKNFGIAVSPYQIMDDCQHSYDLAEKWCRQKVIAKPVAGLFYDVQLFHKSLKETATALNFPLQV